MRFCFSTACLQEIVILSWFQRHFVSKSRHTSQMVAKLSGPKKAISVPTARSTANAPPELLRSACPAVLRRRGLNSVTLATCGPWGTAVSVAMPYCTLWNDSVKCLPAVVRMRGFNSIMPATCGAPVHCGP